MVAISTSRHRQTLGGFRRKKQRLPSKQKGEGRDGDFPKSLLSFIKSTISSKIIAYTEQGMIHWTNQPTAPQKTEDGEIRDGQIRDREIGDRKILDNRDRLQLYIPDENILLAIAAANLVADFQQEKFKI